MIFPVRNWVIQTKKTVKQRLIQVKHRSASINIYHCCVHKTGSQWIKAILSDMRVYEYSGLSPYTYQNKLVEGCDPRKITERNFTEAFPERKIITPIYIDFGNFKNIQKPKNYKAFFIMRDPRDIVISWYYSAKYSHRLMGKLTEARKSLNSMSNQEGILYSINFLEDFGLFEALRSWKEASEQDPNILVLHYENMISDFSFQTFKNLFLHCDISLSDRLLQELLDNYSFARLRNKETHKSEELRHYRKGKEGSWHEHFDKIVIDSFRDKTGDLIEHLNYQS